MKLQGTHISSESNDPICMLVSGQRLTNKLPDRSKSQSAPVSMRKVVTSSLCCYNIINIQRTGARI